MDLSLELQVPSRTEYIAVVRLVVASLVSARRSVADERIDDLKLAVSEACTNAIEANVASSGGRSTRGGPGVGSARAPRGLHRRLGARASIPRCCPSTRPSPIRTGSTSSGVSVSR